MSKTNLFMQFPIAGFDYYNGYTVLEELTVNKPLTLKDEQDNPHDDYAVEVYYKDVKLGYVPHSSNRKLHQILKAGGSNFFDVRIKHGVVPSQCTGSEIIDVAVWVKSEK